MTPSIREDLTWAEALYLHASPNTHFTRVCLQTPAIERARGAAAGKNDHVRLVLQQQRRKRALQTCALIGLLIEGDSSLFHWLTKSSLIHRQAMQFAQKHFGVCHFH